MKRLGQWFLKNKEWLLSGVFVSVVFSLIPHVREFLKNIFIKLGHILVSLWEHLTSQMLIHRGVLYILLIFPALFFGFWVATPRLHRE